MTDAMLRRAVDAGKPVVDTIVCLSLTEWTAMPQNSHHLMREAARRGYRVLYVDPLGLRRMKPRRQDLAKLGRRLRQAMHPVVEVDAGITRLAPVGIPAQDTELGSAVNRRLLAVQLRRALSRIGARSSILWSYTPHFVDLGRAIGAELVVYYRVDDYTTSPYIDTAYVIRQEAKAVAAADLCVAVNRKSADLMKDARARILVPNGIDLAVYGERGDEDDPVPWIGHPRLVFTGTFDTWVDLGLLSGLASLRPDWQIVLAGEEKVALDDLAALPNVHYLGLLPYGELPALMSHCDIGLVPYHVNDFTMSASIGKIFQYLATGLPVLSTPVLDAADYGDHVTTAPTDAAGFVEAAVRVLAADSPDERCARRSYGLAQTWTNRFDALESEIGRRLARSG